MKIIYENLLSAATLTPQEQNASYPASNLNKLATTDEWRTLDATGAKTLVIDFGSAKAVSGCAIIGNNYSRSLAFTGATLEASSTGVWDGSQVTVATLSVDGIEAVASAFFTEVSYRYFRVSFTGSGSYLGASNIFIGKAFSFDANGFDQGFSSSEQDLSKVSVGRTGRRFIDEVNVRVKKLSLSVSVMDKTEVGQWLTFVRYVSITKPFYLIVDELELIATNKDTLSGMFLMDSSSTLQHTTLGIWNTSFSVSEVI